VSGTTPFDCPRCGTGLAMSERQGIEIDYCPQCRGVWLDRGELDKLIERAGASNLSPSQGGQGAPGGWPQPAPPPRQQQSWGDDRYRHGGKRRKSWLEEIFD
jgi:Zn-finger nucleic acid-binding protein